MSMLNDPHPEDDVPGLEPAPAVPVVGRASVSAYVPQADAEPEPAPAVPVRGRASVRPVSPAGAYAPEPVIGAAATPGKTKKPGAKKRKNQRRNIIIAVAAVVVLLSGVALMGATYFYDSVPRPDELALKNTTEIYAADNTTQLAKLGTENRSEVSMEKLPKQVKDALIAGEDKNFYDHDGIDLWGIGRAAWVNLTNGEQQGASTITQQYARRAANDMDISYARKLREAVMARKLEDEYSKEQIMGFYLNTVYFGRGAYGVGAAAEAYFKIPPDKIDTMTVAQAAVLGAVLRQPEAEGDHKGYDPANNPEAAKDRWNYVLNNMIEMKWLSEQEKAALKYPAPADPAKPQPGELQPFDPAVGAGAWGWTDRGTGYVVNYVARELEERGVVKYLNDNELGNWKNAGLRITTTINPSVQDALEAQLNRAREGSWVAGMPPNIVGAAVAIEPSTGKVLGYYGGTNNGTDQDWAGVDEPHQPASSFKMYTLAAAVEANISTLSHWDSNEMKKSEGDKVDLKNANREADVSCGEFCTLEQMTVQSYNTPFWLIADKIGANKVLDMAKRAGIRTVWTTDPVKPYDISKGVPSNVFDPYVGIGQYPITVLDHASGTATFAAHGVYNKPIFVTKVERKNNKTGEWEKLAQGDAKIGGQQVIPARIADEVTSVLKGIGPNLQGGFERAGKTGTWENGIDKSKNAHAWYTGFTNQVATSIWIGSLDHNKTPIKKGNGSSIGSGDVKTIWGNYMNLVNKNLKLKPEKLTSQVHGAFGSKDVGNGKSPSPSPEPTLPPTTAPPTPTVTPTKKPTPTVTPTKSP
ncbi:transglycosylase domain-containing protein [Catelliglobosispora koreensis]|uniref:transglycosylase domain-containing protein n=1 Tax=Catelliglobosispora koreensis TaxID=129052 RepID=UPI00036233B8|nr:transglycosylase domain-containing protein [Catelliglobosispora koreensis]